MSRFRNIIPVVFLLLLFSSLAVSSAMRKSATWDETHYLGVGDYLISHFTWNIPSITLHPPLPYYINSVPLLFCKLEASCMKEGRTNDILSGVGRGLCLLEKSRPSGDRLLLLARLPTVCLGILLGCFIYLWAFQLFGRSGAFFSLFLFSLSPNILAHTRLITPDMCLTTFGFICAYYLWQYTRKPSLKNALWSGIFLGLTLLSKYSGLLWLPIALFLVVLTPILKAGVGSETKGERGGNIPLGEAPLKTRSGAWMMGGLILCTALFLVTLGYGFQLSHYFSGIISQGQIVGEGFPAFLNGQVSRAGGWWYYYLFALLIKVPIPMILFLAAAVFLWKRDRTMHVSGAVFLILPPLMFIGAFSCLQKVNLGLRYILPAFPFLMVLAGSLLAGSLWKKYSRWLWVLPLSLWYIYETMAIHPHYLAYFNQFIGGPERGFLHLVDSNLDWGQDLKGLKNYMDREGIKKVKLSYFGTGDPDQYGIRYDALPSFLLMKPTGGPHPQSYPLEKGNILAVSATNLYPIYVDLKNLGEHLRETSPVDQIGYSILIYRLDRPIEFIPHKPSNEKS